MTSPLIAAPLILYADNPLTVPIRLMKVDPVTLREVALVAADVPLGTVTAFLGVSPDAAVPADPSLVTTPTFVTERGELLVSLSSAQLVASVLTPLFAPLEPGAVLANDIPSRTNNALTPGNPDSGPAWQVQGGVFGTLTRSLYSPSGDGTLLGNMRLAFMDMADITGAAAPYPATSCKIGITINALAAGQSLALMPAHLGEWDHYLVVVTAPGAGIPNALYLQQMIGPSPGTRIVLRQVPYTLTIGDRIEAQYDPLLQTITVWVNGVVVLVQRGCTLFPGSTQLGVAMTDVSARVTNITVAARGAYTPYLIVQQEGGVRGFVPLTYIATRDLLA